MSAQALQQIGDAMQSAFSRVLGADGSKDSDYEWEMGALEGQTAIDRWTAVQIVDTGCALCGLRFEELLAGPMAVAQHKVWSMLPDAMQDVDPEVVWATRRFALGEALTRVPRALHAVAGAWLPEGPVAVTDLRGRWW